MRDFFRLSTRQKIFCIGYHKTGTTSLQKALKDLGYKVDNEDNAYTLLHYYEKRDFKPIIKHCKKADAFQDSPFCELYTFMFLEQAFPEAKFILSVRNSPEEWYNSLLRFHARMFGNGEVPTAEQLKNARRPGNRSVYQNMKMRFNVPDENMYQKDILTGYYQRHNEIVRDYFRLKPEKLLEINVGEAGAYKQMCDFLGIEPVYEEFPWEKRTGQW